MGLFVAIGDSSRVPTASRRLSVYSALALLLAIIIVIGIILLGSGG
jgi:hypothetical protein